MHLRLASVGVVFASMTSSALHTDATSRLVFCHFMIGVASNREAVADYDSDMKHAKALGIDAFALNIGIDSYTDTQLDLAYESASKNNMNVFLSFDFNWYNTGDGHAIGAKIKKYANLPAQLMVEGKVFVSSFGGKSVDMAALTAAAGMDILFVPNFDPDVEDLSSLQGAFNWMAWPNNGNNKAPTFAHNVTVSDGDNKYIRALAGKFYIAPISAWFFTHFGNEVSYSKNWVFPSDLLWYDRWQEILELKPQFVEIISWNDYGESHYVGPLSSPHVDDGASKWAMDMPHNGWLVMAKPFIAAYKAGEKGPNNYITEEKLIYWYRPVPKHVECDSTDRGRPNGYETVADQVFVVSLLKLPAIIEVNSGGIKTVFNASPGASAFAAPMGIGKQKFSLLRNGKTIISDISLKEVSESCICGIYNFNAYVGTIPPDKTIDRLQPAGLSKITEGLNVPCPSNTLV